MATVTELGPGIWQLHLRGVNAYLVEDDVLTLVDAGWPLSASHIGSGIAASGHRLGDVGRVLVTHYDLDHVGALARINVTPPVYLGNEDLSLFTGTESPPLGNRKGLLHRAIGPLVGAPADIRPVADGDEIGSFTAYHTPGHTPGHTAYVSEDLSAAFVGDLVIERDGDLCASPWYLSYDAAEVRDSIHDLADRAPAVEVLAMGHGTPFVREGSIRLAELGQRLEA